MNSTIPKIIHYCWFGNNPLPTLAQKCIESWKKYLPDYEIKEWNENNFDVNIIPYTQEAYKAKKYAFVSDYARFYILYKYGGLYFDTDVEVIKPLDDIIKLGAFMGCELDGNSKTRIAVAPGLGLAAKPNMYLYKEILDVYEKEHFYKNNEEYNLKTVVDYMTEVLYKHRLQNVNTIQIIKDIYIYPTEYFCPISVEDGKLRITSNTRTIHHYAQSWQSPIRKYGRKIALILGGTKFKEMLKRIFIK